MGYNGFRWNGEQLFTSGIGVEAIEPEEAWPFFHFSKAPTVTTGFHAFVFDIRREQK